MTYRTLPTILTAHVLAVFLGCASDSGDGDSGTCNPGNLGCECSAGLCLEGLECVANVCQVPGGTDESGTDTGASETGTTTGGDTSDGTGTTTAGETGTTGDTGETDGTPTADTGCAGMMCDGVCVEDPMTDDAHCGTCGNACTVQDGVNEMVGGCENGACLPAYTDCIDLAGVADGTTCEDVCGDLGSVCAADSCEGESYKVWLSTTACEGWAANAINGIGGCTYPLVRDGSGNGLVRCCCQ